MPRQGRQSVRRVVLPSGKSIEVVYFEDSTANPAPGDVRHVDGLHVCPNCDSHLVHPVAWAEAGPTTWRMTLECPNCEWIGGGEFDQELVDEFEEHLDRGTKDLVRDLQRLERANMEEEIDRFVHALKADGILPMDF